MVAERDHVDAGANSSSASFGVMPMPPAAFSPLTTTKSGASSSRSAGSSVSSAAPAGAADDVADEEDRGVRRHGADAIDRGAHTLVRWRTLPDPDTPPPAGVEPVLLPRWVQLVLLPLAVLGVVAVLRAAGAVVLLFIVAALVALLLNPFVALLRRARFPRGVAVLTVMATVVLRRGRDRLPARQPDRRPGRRRSSENVPGIVDDANASLADFQDWLDDNGIDVQVAEEGQTALQTLGAQPVARARASSSRSRSDALQTLVEASIALILVIVLSVYMLLYGERIGAAVRSIVPRGDGTPEDDYPTRIQAPCSATSAASCCSR